MQIYCKKERGLKKEARKRVPVDGSQKKHEIVSPVWRSN
jgi:hypothetical protein